MIRQEGGRPPQRLRSSPRRLSLAEREEISRGLRAGESLRRIGGRVGRAASTISREVAHNGGRRSYRAWQAERVAADRARRPKRAKLATSRRLRMAVEALLARRWSPAQIAARLRHDHPHAPEMWVSPETIYQSLFVQGRGALRGELARCLRSGRAQRRPRGRGRADARGQIPDMILISERPAEADDRAVPGHWEGDLLMGRANGSAIGTLVERRTRYLVLVALPNGRTAEAVRDALAQRIETLPEQLRRSLTWDRGKEMADHVRFTVETGVEVYFCDPHSPWQRGSNENTNGLLRQYFPKGTDLSAYDQDQLDAVARELNGRPRQTLGWLKPSEAFAEVVASTG
ncbi:MAG: IS30 family transposase [Chloroflexota bacterium]|nr:IS30 family transposase [Chloroflexota bacterium]